MNYGFQAAAEAEHLDQVAYYELQRPGLGARYLAEVEEALRTICAAPHRHPGERIYSFWVNLAAYQRNAGFRMDFLLVTPDLVPRITADGIDAEYRARDKPGDHAPVWIELD